MATFGAGAYRNSPGRSTAPGFRFTLYAILSILLMFFDHRGRWLEPVRAALNAAAYPLQLAVSSPTAAWRWVVELARTRDMLQAENAQLRLQERALEMKTLRFEALARENGELRGLRDALPPLADHWLVGEVVDAELNNLSQRVLINKGTRNGVFKGQAVMDSHGLLGQTVHVGPWSAEIILITDSEHAVPVQIERTGVRTIAVGAGEALALPYLPANADVKPGDLLITSGLGGVFPQGYPVGRVAEVRHDAIQPLAQIRAVPLARLDQLREVMLVWFRPDQPASPSAHSEGSDLSHGNAAFVPQPAPARVPAAAGRAPVAPPATPSGVTTARPTATAATPVATAAGPGVAAPRGTAAAPRSAGPSPKMSAAPRPKPATAQATESSSVSSPAPRAESSDSDSQAPGAPGAPASAPATSAAQGSSASSEVSR